MSEARCRFCQAPDHASEDHTAVGYSGMLNQPVSEARAEDERITAWDRICRHPFFADCFQNGVLLDHMIAKLDEVSEVRGTDQPNEMPTESGVYIPAIADIAGGPNVYVLYGNHWRMSPDIGNADEHASAAHERWGLVRLVTASEASNIVYAPVGKDAAGATLYVALEREEADR